MTDPGFLPIPAAFAAPPPWGETARPHLAPCGDPDRQEQRNYDENQLNTNPDTSGREIAQKRRRVCVGWQAKMVVLPEPGRLMENLLSKRYQGPEQRSRTLPKLP